MRRSCWPAGLQEMAWWRAKEAATAKVLCEPCCAILYVFSLINFLFLGAVYVPVFWVPTLIHSWGGMRLGWVATLGLFSRSILLCMGLFLRFCVWPPRASGCAVLALTANPLNSNPPCFWV